MDWGCREPHERVKQSTSSKSTQFLLLYNSNLTFQLHMLSLKIQELYVYFIWHWHCPKYKKSWRWKKLLFVRNCDVKLFKVLAVCTCIFYNREKEDFSIEKYKCKMKDMGIRDSCRDDKSHKLSPFVLKAATELCNPSREIESFIPSICKMSIVLCGGRPTM
jgi:hypothetical protein